MSDVPARSAPTEEERTRAKKAARTAARTGAALTRCPFDAGGTTRERILALVWVREYLAVQGAAADAVDYAGDGPEEPATPTE